MLKGYLDVVTSSGHIEGWAYDSERELWPLTIRIVGDGRELGVGSAHGFRGDLAAAGLAAGWCAFRIRLADAAGVRTFGLVVKDAEGRDVLLWQQVVPYSVREETPIRSVLELVEHDPTVIASLDQLQSCNPLFEQFVSARGVESFVRTAYLYLLKRPADQSGLRGYGRHLSCGQVTPFELLLTMADSDEYRSCPRYHWAPTAAAFPFRLG